MLQPLRRRTWAPQGPVDEGGFRRLAGDSGGAGHGALSRSRCLQVRARGRRDRSSCSSFVSSKASTCAKMGHNSAEYIHTVIEAAKLAFADRERYYGDPEFVKVPLKACFVAALRRRTPQARSIAKKASPEMRPGSIRSDRAATASIPRAGSRESSHGCPGPSAATRRTPAPSTATAT